MCEQHASSYSVTAEQLVIKSATYRLLDNHPTHCITTPQSVNAPKAKITQTHCDCLTSSSFCCVQSAAASLRWKQAIWSCSLGTWSCSVALSHSAIFSCCSSWDTLSDNDAICLSALHFAWHITPSRVNSAYYPHWDWKWVVVHVAYLHYDLWYDWTLHCRFFYIHRHIQQSINEVNRLPHMHSSGAKDILQCMRKPWVLNQGEFFPGENFNVSGWTGTTDWQT